MTADPRDEELCVACWEPFTAGDFVVDVFGTERDRVHADIEGCRVAKARSGRDS